MAEARRAPDDRTIILSLPEIHCAGCIATVAYTACVNRIGAARGSVVPSAIPATAVAIGAPLLGEYPTELQLWGIAVTTLGLLMAVGLLDAFRRR